MHAAGRCEWRSTQHAGAPWDMASHVGPMLPPHVGPIPHHKPILYAACCVSAYLEATLVCWVCMENPTASQPQPPAPQPQPPESQQNQESDTLQGHACMRWGAASGAARSMQRTRSLLEHWGPASWAHPAPQTCSIRCMLWTAAVRACSLCAGCAWKKPYSPPATAPSPTAAAP